MGTGEAHDGLADPLEYGGDWRLRERSRHEIDVQRAIVGRGAPRQLDLAEPAVGQFGDDRP